MFSSLITRLRQELLEMLSKFHEESYNPEWFVGSHVLRGKDGKLRMVGFTDAGDHLCGFNSWYFNKDLFVPSAKQVGCPKLYVLGEDLNMWQHCEFGLRLLTSNTNNRRQGPQSKYR